MTTTGSGKHDVGSRRREPDAVSRQCQPVVIVGAGPTGVLLAIELARRGVGVRVFDKLSSRPQESRAFGIQARTLEIFRQLGLVEEFLELGHRMDGVTVHTQRRKPVRMRFDGVDSPYPFILALRQDETQRILDEHLRRLGVTIERGVEVIDLAEDGDGVRLRVARTREPEERTVIADWVVGCDGAHSIVRRWLGVPFEGDDYGQDWLMAEVQVDWPLASDCFHLFSYTGAPLVALPLPSGCWRVFLPQVPNRAGDRPPPDMDEIERLAAQRGPAGMKLTDPSMLATFRCYRRSTPSMRQGRVLVAGDAAHIHTPAGGQGMNTGLQDSFNLGWKLALVATRQSPSALLDTYDAERVPIATGVLAFTHSIVRSFTIASPRKRWLRNHILATAVAVPALRHRLTDRWAQVSLNYRGRPLAPPASPTSRRSIAAGDRLPDVAGLRLDGHTVTTLDLLHATEHTLLVLTGEGHQVDAARAAAARFERYDRVPRIMLITPGAATGQPGCVIDPRLRAHRRYGARMGRLLLVRPDGYVACTAPLNRPDISERYVRQLMIVKRHRKMLLDRHRKMSVGGGV